MEIQPGDRDTIKARQRAWATRNGRMFDADGYCACVDDNIFQGLSLAAGKDFESGDGAELGKGGGRDVPDASAQTQCCAAMRL